MAMSSRTIPSTSLSLSGAITAKGYSTRQSVASVTCDTRESPSNRMLPGAVCLDSAATSSLRLWAVNSKWARNRSTASVAR